MTVPLSRDRTGEVAFGIDLAHRGLYCRFVGCREHFDPRTSDSAFELRVAGDRRNVHELAEHGYRHVIQPSKAWTFAQKFSREGRSTMKQK